MHRVPIFTIFCDKLGSGPIFRELSELTRKRQRPTWRRSEATCPDISDIARYFPMWADILRYSRYPPITRDSDIQLRYAGRIHESTSYVLRGESYSADCCDVKVM